MGISGIAVDGEGYVYLYSSNSVCVLNPDFTKAFDCAVDTYIRALSVSQSGEVYITTYGAAHPIDKSAGNIGSQFEFPSGAEVENFIYFGGGGYDCFFKNSDGLCGFNFSDGEAEMIMDW